MRRMPALTALGDLGQQDILKILEVIGLAEEIRLIRRHGVDEMYGFRFDAFLIEQKITIGIERRMARHPKASPKAAFEHRCFGRGHLDAAVLVNVTRQAIEISLA